MTWIVSIANEKGGVAKTTTTLSLGGAFAELGYRVLLIDLDPQANLTLSFGFEPDSSYRSIINIFMENIPIQKAIKTTEIDRISILPSNTEICSKASFFSTSPSIACFNKFAAS